jgi:multisubunit Na+/H+ antiporter MnhG subunit
MNAAVDAAIYICLIISIGFAGIGVIGLLLFPDIRSRMYTAFRATVISFCAMILSVLIYGLSTFNSGGGDQYITLVLHSLVLLCIVALSHILLYKMILNRSKSSVICREPQERSKDNN